MTTISIPKNHQLFWLNNDKAIGGVDSIKINTITHQLQLHKPHGWIDASVDMVGILNLDNLEDEGCPIEDWVTELNEY